MNAYNKPVSSSIFFFFLFLCLVSANNIFAQKNKFTIVIDPGHGGKDPGAIGVSSREKDIALAVGIRLGDLIKSNHPDVNVVYTRDADYFVTLNNRADIANKAHADLFVSIHCNALDRKKTSPQGVETFVLGLHRSKDNLDVAKTENSVILYEEDYSAKYAGFNPHEPESYIIFEFMTNRFLEQSVYLATLVQNRLVNSSKRVNRNVRQAGFLVLREVAMPSILVELGYISNRNDEQYLKSAAGQKSMANSIYEGFKEYKREYDKKSHVFTNVDARKSEQQTVNASSITTPDSVVSSGETEYRVQFLTASRQQKEGASVFKGLSPVDFYKDGSLIKYTYGSTSDMDEIKKTLRYVQQKFKDAFIIEFKDGKRIK